MFASTVVVAVVLAAAFAAAGASKLARAPRTVDMADRLGIARNRYRLIGIPEVLGGAAGVLVGLKVVAVGIAAAAGLAAIMIGAVATHHRADDRPKHSAPAVGLAVITAMYLALRTASA